MHTYTQTNKACTLNMYVHFYSDTEQTPANSPRPSLQETAAPPNVESINFKEKQYGTVDVWWLYDDGGIVHVSRSLLYNIGDKCITVGTVFLAKW